MFVREHDEGVDVFQPRSYALDHREKAAIEQQHDAPCVVQGVDDLLVGQPWIGGMQHGTDARYGEK